MLISLSWDESVAESADELNGTELPAESYLGCGLELSQKHFEEFWKSVE